tara:strand:- start:85 stop:360 length:276 start_codon:yes stop_codon:yes gene_type:complete
MKGMLEDVQLVASVYVMQTFTQSESEELSAAIQEVSAIPPSIGDQKGTVNNINSGSGTFTVYNAQRDLYTNPGSGRMYNAQTMQSGGDGKD